jgi:hypothetical protein
LKKLLAEILEEHYATDKGASPQQKEYISLSDLDEKLKVILDAVKNK